MLSGGVAVDRFEQVLESTDQVLSCCRRGHVLNSRRFRVTFIRGVFSLCLVMVIDGDEQTYASYGVNGEKARYCAKHKGVNMVNLTVKHCEYTECVTQPSFNYQGQRKARYFFGSNSRTFVICPNTIRKAPNPLTRVVGRFLKCCDILAFSFFVVVIILFYTSYCVYIIAKTVGF